MPEKFRKWIPWIVAALLCFSLLVNVQCVMLLFRYRQIYQAPPVWVTPQGEYVTSSPVATPMAEAKTENSESTPENLGHEDSQTDLEAMEDSESEVSIDKTGSTVYLTKSGSKFHRDGCSSLSKSRIAISYEDAVSRGFEPCGRCKP